MEPLAGRIAVLGTGVTGQAVARYILDHATDDSELTVDVWDERDDDRAREAARSLVEMGAKVHIGSTSVEGAYTLAVASPGIPPTSALMRSASEASDKLISEIELAYTRSVAPWLAVTGTNGKTTVASLCSHLLTYAGHPNECVGNIGDPAIAAAEQVGASGVIVAEVSSFQLALTQTFHPRIGVLLNITPDHLDWHGSHEAYVSDKGRLFTNMGPGDVAVIDVDDSGSAPFADRVEASGARVMRVSRTHVPPGGAGMVDGTLVLDTPEGERFVVGAGDLRIRGAHNLSNALAAAAAVYACGVPVAQIGPALSEFDPIPHRMQPVGVVDGAEYINDSKATNPGAARMAISAFGDRPMIVLLGGRNKGNDFAELRSDVSDARLVVAFGEAGREIDEALSGAGAPVVRSETLGDAIRVAHAHAEPGDVVVLTPSCASFDEFTGYAQRGDFFARAIRDLADVEASS